VTIVINLARHTRALITAWRRGVATVEVIVTGNACVGVKGSWIVLAGGAAGVTNAVGVIGAFDA
jgi:hypothetical protein